MRAQPVQAHTHFAVCLARLVLDPWGPSRSRLRLHVASARLSHPYSLKAGTNGVGGREVPGFSR